MKKPSKFDIPGPESAEEAAENANAATPAVDVPYRAGFGKALSHSEKQIRNKAFRTLSTWLTQQPSLSKEDWQKIWKGLFYCYWMSDKPEVQHELALKMSRLMKQLSADSILGYFEGFFITMNREWQGIDVLRLDKFYDLMRCFIREIFAVLAAKKWPKEECKNIGAVLDKEAISPLNATTGIRQHIADIFLGELEAAVNAETRGDSLVPLLQPFIIALSQEICDKSYKQRLVDRIFERLCSGTWSYQSRKKRKRPDDENNNNNEDNENEEDSIGLNKTALGQLCSRLSSYAFQLGSNPATTQHGRKNLYEVHKILDKAATKISTKYKFIPQPVEIDAVEVQQRNEDKNHQSAKKNDTATATATATNNSNGKKTTKNKKPQQQQQQPQQQSTPKRVRINSKTFSVFFNKTDSPATITHTSKTNGGDHESKVMTPVKIRGFPTRTVPDDEEEDATNNNNNNNKAASLSVVAPSSPTTANGEHHHAIPTSPRLTSAQVFASELEHSPTRSKPTQFSPRVTRSASKKRTTTK